MEHSERFENAVYSQINFEWFRQYGVNPDNMRVIISPAGSRGGYGAWRYADTPDDITIYAGMPGSDSYEGWYIPFVAHEFAHRLGNPVADVWYAENEEFRGWADRSVDVVRFPEYAQGITMAYEYLTRAYTILYMVDNHGANVLQLLLAEKGGGFPYIERVYAMITEFDILDGIDIKMILGVDYTIGEEEHVFNMPDGRIIIWRFIDLHGNQLPLHRFSSNEVGNILRTQTGDVVIVNINGSQFLYIDVGAAEAGWSTQHRAYSVFPLD